MGIIYLPKFRKPFLFLCSALPLFIVLYNYTMIWIIIIRIKHDHSSFRQLRPFGSHLVKASKSPRRPDLFLSDWGVVKPMLLLDNWQKQHITWSPVKLDTKQIWWNKINNAPGSAVTVHLICERGRGMCHICRVGSPRSKWSEWLVSAIQKVSDRIHLLTSLICDLRCKHEFDQTFPFDSLSGSVS